MTFNTFKSICEQHDVALPDAFKNDRVRALIDRCDGRESIGRESIKDQLELNGILTQEFGT